MKTIHVTASKSYMVHIGSGIIDQLGQFAVHTRPNAKVAIISDSNVWPLYGQQAEKNILEAGLQVIHYVFPAGEASKNGTVSILLSKTE